MPQLPICVLLSRGDCQPTGYGNDFVSKLKKVHKYAWEHAEAKYTNVPNRLNIN